MISLRRLFASLAVSACAVAGLGSQVSAASPEGMKLYVFSSGALTIDKSALQSTAGPGKIQIPVGFFLIKHPKGNVLFDTGNNDRIIQDITYWGPLAALDPVRTPDVAIDTQLGKVGVKPADVNYVILGHMHLDHAGNVGKFPTSTIVVQRDEVTNAFFPPASFAAPYITTDFSMLRSNVGSGTANKQPMIELDGDLDLFGDGSVYIRRAVSHTPGSQFVIVRLPKSGTVVLTGDVCYLMDNLNKDILPSIGLTFNPTGMFDAYQYIKRVRDTEKGDVIFAHDPDVYKAHKHAPEFYE